MVYKFMSIVSEKKWNAFSDEKKIKFFEDFYFRIEKLFLKKVYDIEIANLQYYVTLAQEETNATLLEIADIFQKSIKVGLDEENEYGRVSIKTKKVILLDLLTYLRPVFGEKIEAQKDFHFLPHIEISTSERQAHKRRLPVILILDNLRSAFNVGSIIRTAECLNIEAVWFCGYTPKPSHPKVQNTAMGTHDKIIWEHFNETKDAISKAKQLGYLVYALETSKHAKSFFTQRFIKQHAFVLGNEALGIPEHIIDMCDKCLKLPISGWKQSLNVATTCAVVCFEVFRQRRNHNEAKSIINNPNSWKHRASVDDLAND